MFGHDEETPGGYQDADLETAAFEQAASEQKPAKPAPPENTPGAMRAAEAITGLRYNNPDRTTRMYGLVRTTRDIAELIDNETNSRAAIEALTLAVDALQYALKTIKMDWPDTWGDSAEAIAERAVRAALAKMKGQP